MNVLYQIGKKGKRKDIKGEKTYEEAKELFSKGKTMKECAKLCGMSVSGFKKRVNVDEGKPANEGRCNRYSLVPKNKAMEKFHKVSLDEKVRMAKELGISYGKYVAMEKMGAIY